MVFFFPTMEVNETRNWLVTSDGQMKRLCDTIVCDTMCILLLKVSIVFVIYIIPHSHRSCTWTFTCTCCSR